MNRFNSIQTSRDENKPIFSLCLSLTGSNLTADAGLLNTLMAAGTDSSPEVKEKLCEIQDEFLHAHKKVTELFENVLSELFGSNAISKSETQSVCTSTAFYIGGDDNEDE